MLDYLQSPDLRLWQYRDGGDVAVGPEGNLIAFSAEISEVLREVNRQLGGVPNYTACLILLSAMNPNYDRLSQISLHASQVLATAGASVESVKLNRLLRTIVGLPYGIRHAPLQKANVIAALMPDDLSCCRSMPSSEFEEITHWLSSGIHERDQSVIPQPSNDFRANSKQREELNATGRLLNQIVDQYPSVDSIQRCLRTGVKDIPLPVKELDRLESDSIGELIRQLKQDPELSRIAGAAESVASTLTLPVRLSEYQELPLGGVSDIVNRGEPERLLSTEIAADPLLMLARIVNGQALYLRRESPPNDGQRVREILIENSVRCWGESRLRMLAVALGVAASEESRNAEVIVHTVAGKELFRENLTTKEGITKQLEHLSPSRHPGKAIAHWGEQSKVAGLELLVVLSEKVFQDSDFQQSIQSIPKPYLVVVIGRDGTARLIRRKDLGDEVLKTIPIEFSEATQASAKEIQKELPLMLSLRRPPLRFPVDHVDWYAPSRDGLWVFGTGKRILWFHRQGCGGREVVSYLRAKEIVAHHSEGHSIHFVFHRGRSEFFIATVNAMTGECVEQPIENPDNCRYFFDDGHLFAMSPTLFSWIDIHSGRILATKAIRGIPLSKAPFAKWYEGSAVSVSQFYPNGNELEEHVYRDFVSKGNDIAAIVRGPNNIPVAIDKNLSCLFALSEDRKVVPIDTKESGGEVEEIKRVSTDKQTAIVKVNHLGNSYGRTAHSVLLNLSTGALKVLWGPLDTMADQLRLLAEPCFKMVSHYSIRKKISRAWVDQEGFFLVSRSTPVKLLHDNGRLFLKSMPNVGSYGQELGDSFGVTLDATTSLVPPHVDRTNWHLRRLDLGEATLWADSRGLLHLKQKHHAMEISLVLNDNNMAGWTSFGHLFGPKLFHGGPEDIRVPQEVATWLEEWKKACLT